MTLHRKALAVPVQPDATAYLIHVVDDDPALSDLVAINLIHRGYRVSQFDNGQAFLDSLQETTPDLVVLDIVMPGINGLEVTSQLRQFSQVPILMVSVWDEVATKLHALESGVDDYLIKPFEVEELLARIGAILRRANPFRDASYPVTYSCGSLVVDVTQSQAISDGRRVKLTPREWGLLRVLIGNAGRVVSSRQLLQEAWGSAYGDETDYIRAYITRLRQKLEPDPTHPKYILLERGIGYRLAQPGGD